MMSMGALAGITLVYLLSLFFIGFLTYLEFRKVRFNFNILFSVLYLLTFYFGYPLTCMLIFIFNAQNVGADSLFYTLLCSTSFYAIYYVSYRVRLFKHTAKKTSFLTMDRLDTKLTWVLLALVAITAVTIFFLNNGFLLFKLTSYSQIFSSSVSGVALKRFFYFFIPAMLIIYFLKPTKANWFLFLLITALFGLCTYAVVGGTRANIMIAFALFLFIGIARGYISLWMLFIAGAASIVGMYFLAILRYNLDVSGSEAFYTFLYLTRDTFSPWENLALLLQNYEQIEFQGIMPILRDFYVYIPSWVWPERPNLVLNTANYFTWNVLNYHTGLAISPTLIGSLLIMGGIPFVFLGAIVVGFIIKWFDWLYELGKTESNRYKSAIIQSFCFGAIFNLIVLVREGIDSFVSRVVFFCLVFGICLLIAKLLYWLFLIANVVRERHSKKI